MITLYDIHTNFPGHAMSPFAWRTRLCLNYKGIPFKTHWVEYIEVENVCKSLGASPTGTKSDGTPTYTVPVIHDSSTNTILSDSFPIAQYLDKTYPNTPKVIPENTDILQAFFAKCMLDSMINSVPFVRPYIPSRLNAVSSQIYKERKQIEEVLPIGEVRERLWKQLHDSLSVVDGYLAASASCVEQGPWVMGKTMSFADMAIASFFISITTVWGEGSEEWEDMKQWHGGKWEAIVKNMEPYSTPI